MHQLYDKIWGYADCIHFVITVTLKYLFLTDMWDSNTLSHLYDFFKGGRGRYLVLYSPIIELEDGAEDGAEICSMYWGNKYSEAK